MNSTYHSKNWISVPLKNLFIDKTLHDVLLDDFLVRFRVQTSTETGASWTNLKIDIKLLARVDQEKLLADKRCFTILPYFEFKRKLDRNHKKDEKLGDIAANGWFEIFNDNCHPVHMIKNRKDGKFKIEFGLGEITGVDYQNAQQVGALSLMSSELLRLTCEKGDFKIFPMYTGVDEDGNFIKTQRQHDKENSNSNSSMPPAKKRKHSESDHGSQKKSSLDQDDDDVKDAESEQTDRCVRVHSLRFLAESPFIQNLQKQDDFKDGAKKECTYEGMYEDVMYFAEV